MQRVCQKLLETKKNEITFTSGNGFKPNFQNYWIILFLNTLCNQFSKRQPITVVTHYSLVTSLNAEIRQEKFPFSSIYSEGNPSCASYLRRREIWHYFLGDTLSIIINRSLRWREQRPQFWSLTGFPLRKVDSSTPFLMFRKVEHHVRH